MRFYSSEIVADGHNIELELFRSEEERRLYLIEWFNDHVENGGLGDVDPLQPNSTAEQATVEIETVVGRPVILGEVYV